MKGLKRFKVIKTFDSIADRYILANHLLSFWQDICWRKTMFNLISQNLENRDIFVDVATGTGENFKYCHSDFRLKIGLDPARKMLEIAKRRFENVQFIEGMAETLPFKNETADLITVSFGVRNFEDRKKSFEEFNRVLRKGGILGILEFFPMENGTFINKAAAKYIYDILPYLGGVITGNFNAYKYLSKSIKNFILPNIMKLELENVGFNVIEVERLFPNVYIFIAKKVKSL
ncbi:demethylmenaquinone methyltransferase [Persephonella hydrogeniphila]|uniref:Demethylmenaquinone methyltransferase n=1 Tax=Persephonella hydrogeniphila TaxID=198703 RepID=A0A285N3A4_9AQUI|nr:ubiquinone/menaquinone biosynthesis methyltransferase [Persephonella hydrogeniphila]SNZ03307.1 demethylmenaquinone methyltransferase [Persephonella hydrogeniphila]